MKMKTKIKSRPRRLRKIDVSSKLAAAEFFKQSQVPAVTTYFQNIIDKSERDINRAQAIDAVRMLIRFIGEDPDRPGLKDTPERVIKAWENTWGIGYNRKFIQEQTLSILGAHFDDGAENYNQMICVRGIKFFSHCEHHLAEFHGSVDCAYIPNKMNPKILGLSKLGRVVNMFSRRLQVQERLTNQIADFLQIHCKPQGVGVVVRATHSCMTSRGIQQPTTEAVTSALRGEMLTDQAVRDEFLRLVGR
jgi:GTP cyclohydrolase I